MIFSRQFFFAIISCATIAQAEVIVLTHKYQGGLANTITLFMTALRDKTTSIATFRKASHEIAHLLALEAMAQLPMTKCTVETPCGIAHGLKNNTNIILVPIWRSGDELYATFLKHFEHARVGFVGLRRNENTAIAEFYYANIPATSHDDYAIILDPMVATGGSATAAVELLKNAGIPEDHILFVALIGAPEGLSYLQSSYPKMNIIIATQDERLNEKKYIVPGLGDFGDRYFGTVHE